MLSSLLSWRVVMPMLTVALMLPVLASGCKTTSEAEKTDASVAKDTPVPDGEVGTGSVALSALTKDGETWPVVVGEDRESATLETPDGLQKLAWNNKTAACQCRTYRNNRFSVLVNFPFGKQEASATVTDLQAELNGDLPGTLKLQNGQSVDVGAVSFSDTRDFMSFDYGGNTETLNSDITARLPEACGCTAFDSLVYSAVVYWSVEGVEGRVEIIEKP